MGYKSVEVLKNPQVVVCMSREQIAKLRKIAVARDVTVKYLAEQLIHKWLSLQEA